MITLYHHPFCPHSRFVRLSLGEMGIEPKLIEERAWERRREFLLMAAEGATPVLVEDHAAGPAGRRGHRRISRRDAGPGPRRSPAAARRPGGSRRSAPAHDLVQRQVLQRSEPVAGAGEDLQALHEPRSGRRRARHARRASGALQSALSSALYRPPDCGPELAGRRPADLRRSRGGGPSFLHRLSGRRAVAGERNRPDLVRAGEVAPLVPPAAGRAPAGRRRRARPTPISTSSGVARQGARARLRRLPGHVGRGRRRAPRAPRRLARRGRAWRHGLDGGCL